MRGRFLLSYGEFMSTQFCKGYFKLSHRFEIWPTHRQHCQISERSHNSKYKSCGFETLRDLTMRRLIRYWNSALVVISIIGTFSALLALCVGNSPVTGEFQLTKASDFYVFLDLCLNKRLSKQSLGWWFVTPSCSLWRHCNAHNDCGLWLVVNSESSHFHSMRPPPVLMSVLTACKLAKLVWKNQDPKHVFLHFDHMSFVQWKWHTYFSI